MSTLMHIWQIRIPGNNKDKELCNYFSKTLNKWSKLLIVELKIYRQLFALGQIHEYKFSCNTTKTGPCNATKK